jgi:protein TonB
LKLNLYIIASLIFHVLFFSAVIILFPEIKADTPAAVYNIDIVGNIGEDDVIPTIRDNREKILIPRKPDPGKILKELLPETILGEGTAPVPDKAGNNGRDGKVLSKGPSEEPETLLFDKETIEKYAQKGSGGGKDLSFDAPEFQHRGYMRMLRDKIESIWQYPKEAARRGISGDLYVRFFIKRDGSLGDVTLVRTSGFKDLDEAAIRALKNGAPYWPLPDDFEKDELSITGHFTYVLGDFYER